MSLLNNNTRGRVELGRIVLCRKFLFSLKWKTRNGQRYKSLKPGQRNGRKVSVEIAGEEGEDAPKKTQERRRHYAKRNLTAKNAATRMSVAARLPANAVIRPEHAVTDKKKNKPSREERGYTKARGKKDYWKQFFQGNNEFKDSEPDFSEEG